MSAWITAHLVETVLLSIMGMATYALCGGLTARLWMRWVPGEQYSRRDSVTLIIMWPIPALIGLVWCIGYPFIQLGLLVARPQDRRPKTPKTPGGGERETDLDSGPILEGLGTPAAPTT
jgi:hypothetical protein